MKKTGILLAVLFAASLLHADVYTKNVVADTLMVQNDNNYGAATGLQLSGWDGANNRYALLKFDITGIDVSKITNVTLNVKNANGSATAQDLFTSALYATGNNTSWEEGAGNATFNADASSWYWSDKINVGSSLNRWSKSSGANASHIEDGAMGSVIASKTTTGALAWGQMVSIQLDAGLFQNFVDSNGIVSLAVNSSAATANALNIFSKEHAQGNTYLEIQTVPEPATLGLMGSTLALIMIVRRRFL